jgi:pyrroloquinoline quinone biosynthesis protein D
MTVSDTERWCPRLVPGIMLRHDQTRDKDLLLMPERVVVLNEGAGRIVGLCDGSRSVDTIVRELSELFPTAPIHDDVPEFLQRMRQEGWMR